MTGHDSQDPEAPEADAAEQSLPIDPADLDTEDTPDTLTDDAAEGDALDQTRALPIEEDDRR